MGVEGHLVGGNSWWEWMKDRGNLGTNRESQEKVVGARETGGSLGDRERLGRGITDEGETTEKGIM